MITKKNLTQLVWRFRELCLKKFEGDIDTISPDERLNRLGHVKDDWASILSLITEPIDDISRIVKTPRLLKQIFRRIYISWESLHGEIDFDDLLVADVLRYGAPEAFDFISENIQEIRGLLSEGFLKDRDDRLKAIEAKWDKIIHDIRWDSTSAKHLVQFLFPCWNDKMNFNNKLFQTVQIESPTDYWERLLLEELGPDGIPDQKVLQSLIRWKKNPSGNHFKDLTVPSILSRSQEYAEKFEQFAALSLDGNDVRNIASALFKEATSIYGVKANQYDIPGFIPLWRRAIRQPVDENEHLEWLLKQISEVLQYSVYFRQACLTAIGGMV